MKMRPAFYRFWIILFICNVLFINYLQGQVVEDGDYTSAVKAHTRSKDGMPGEKYWQNSAFYTMDVSLDKKNNVSGHGTVLYFNNSPDTIFTMYIKLYQNLHRLTTLRATSVDSGYLTAGMHITQLADSENNIDYIEKTARVAYLHDGTIMVVKLLQPLFPHDTQVFDMAWEYHLNNSITTAPREGIIDSTSAFVAYWYPRIAVYDDVQGWDESLQNETSEFYNDFCNYDVKITMPSDFKVFATGSLVHKLTRNDSTLWNYKANDITDFVWAASNHYISDTVNTVVKNDKKNIITAYHSKTKQYPRVADLAALCLQFYSAALPGVEFPFANLTIFEGRSQMEYPMMINDNDEGVYTDMATLTAHEISHMYFPFTMGINETRYAWMDEGWATFFEYHFMNDGLKSEQGVNTFLSFYHRFIKQADPMISSIPLMAPSDQLMPNSYTANSYTKGWLMYETIKNVMGDSLFKKTLGAYIQTWRGKHPTPYDFFSFFSSYSHEDLKWIFNAYAFHFATFDLSVEDVKEKDGFVEATIKNAGGLPMSFTVDMTLKNGKVDQTYVPAKVWQHNTEAIVKLKLAKNANPISIHINTGIYPDVIPANNDYIIKLPGHRPHKHKHSRNRNSATPAN